MTLSQPEETRPEPRLYDITYVDGEVVTMSGYLGINDVYMCLMDHQEQLVFASRIDVIKHCLARPEAIGTQTTQ